jgi:nucleoside-diphosphate-sugar epimerase
MRRTGPSLPNDVLVAGGTGFVGARLVERLLQRPSLRVWVVARRGPPPFDHERVLFRRHDLARPLARLRLPRRVCAVFHCASPPAGASAAELFGVNVQGTLSLLDYAANAGARRFVYVSSGGVAGYRRRPIPETAPPRPGSAYLMAKAAGELAVRTAGSRVPTTIVRLFFPYGPGQRQGLLPLLCGRIAQGEPIQVGQGGAPRLNPVHVHDAARALARIGSAARSDAVINVGGREVLSVRQLALRLARHLGLRPVFERDTRSLHLVGDTRWLRRRHAGWTVGLDRGLAEFARWWADADG